MKKNKKDEENTDTMKFLISELILEIIIFCFEEIAIKTKNENLETLMIILSTIVFLIAVILWGFFERKQKKTKK